MLICIAFANWQISGTGLENFPQYGHVPRVGGGAAAWGSYDMQRAQRQIDLYHVKQSYNRYRGLQLSRLVQGSTHEHHAELSIRCSLKWHFFKVIFI